MICHRSISFSRYFFHLNFSRDADQICLNVSQFNSNNVSQRDYLRTEGDPGAGGYTIKEALALARSVVSKNLFSTI